jgi:hypothetical protein
MADMFQGIAAPDVTTSKTTAAVAPQYWTDYQSKLASAGTTALDKPAGQMVAPLTALQTQGYGQLPTAAASYQPGLAAAETTVGKAAQGMSPEMIQSFMNPYTQNVVGEMERLQQQNIQRNIMPQLKASFVGSGGLGGQRYAGALGQTMADMQANLTGQQTGALQKGYADAMQAAYNQGNLFNQAATTQGNLAGQEQLLGLTGAGALTKGGAEQQAYEQSLIDAPLKNATNVSALMRGYTQPTTTTESATGPIPGVYSPSVMSQIAGLGTLLGSGLGGVTDPVTGKFTKTGFLYGLPSLLKGFSGSLPDFSEFFKSGTTTGSATGDVQTDSVPPSDTVG